MSETHTACPTPTTDLEERKLEPWGVKSSDVLTNLTVLPKLQNRLSYMLQNEMWEENQTGKVTTKSLSAH